MFSVGDIRELLQTFPPPKRQTENLTYVSDVSSPLPSLVHASSGQDLITLQHVQTNFEHHVVHAAEGTRSSVSDLAHDLDVDDEIILQLVQNQPHLALLSDSTEVVCKAERDAISVRLLDALSFGVISKTDFAAQNRISSKSLNQLINDSDEQTVDMEDDVFTEAYDHLINEETRSIVNRVKENRTTEDYTTKDITQLPGSPPRWLVLHHLQRNVHGEGVTVRELPDGIRIQSNEAVSHDIHEWTVDLVSKNVAYIDLQAVRNRKPGLYETIEDVQIAFAGHNRIEIVESFGLSVLWFENLMVSQLKALDDVTKRLPDETCAIDLLDEFYKQVQNTMPSHREFPERLRQKAWEQIKTHAVKVLQREPERGDRVLDHILVTQGELDKARNTLLELAGKDAAAQWKEFTENPNFEIKFNISNVVEANGVKKVIYASLLEDASSRKPYEEKFRATIAELEVQNETDFATFWTDRVDLRVHAYNDGLGSIEDQKLRDQLSEVLATYIQKDLVPDTLTKARSQGLILSRKTKKNVQKLESTLSKADSDLESTLPIVAKFGQKSGLSPASPPALDTYKASMIQDMQRRMAKQQKSSDGPVLFLTLVIVLLAKHYDGVVYATGKYAPKLLRQLKGKLEVGDYEKLEKWKEAAKAGKLGKEDREGMRGMAGV